MVISFFFIICMYKDQNTFTGDKGCIYPFFVGVITHFFYI